MFNIVSFISIKKLQQQKEQAIINKKIFEILSRISNSALEKNPTKINLFNSL